MKKPEAVCAAQRRGDSHALSRLGRSGGLAVGKKRRRAREHEAILQELQAEARSKARSTPNEFDQMAIDRGDLPMVEE